MSGYQRHQLGKEAEEKAYRFLLSKGLRLLEKNFRCRYGEIDLIMQDHKDIVFVEVRSKSNINPFYGHALDSITPTKMKKLIRSATYYLQLKKCLHSVIGRFDVIAIHLIDGKMHLEWFENAFSAE